MRLWGRPWCRVAAACWLASAPAAAQPTWLSGVPPNADAYSLPDAPAPPSLPDLTHRGLAVGLETTFASIQPHDAITGPQPRSVVWIERLEAEVATLDRHLFFGVADEAAYGSPPGTKNGSFLFGYPEIWGRGVWSSRVGLSYGGGLSLVVPVFNRAPDSAGALSAESVRVVRPWDFALFAENTFTAMPYVDARIIDGSVTFQMRQGLALQGLVAEAQLPKANVVSHTTLYLGYQPLESLALGLELWEVYFVSSDFTAICQARSVACSDSARASFAVSPSVRFLTRAFQPALSVILPFDRTLFDEVQSYWAVRLTLGAIFDNL